MYSPFYSSNGKPLKINQLKYQHLSQLLDCDEGHHLEYKRALEDGGNAQLAKEIASFANCEGGWLIVGIDDKSKAILPIEKADYSQKIGKIACRISPFPEFETRFLKTPGDKTKGVLVVYVYEGRNAPYVCNGSVYIRSGSSKEPIKPADRGNIEYLYERSRQHEKEIESFCVRDHYYSYNPILQKHTLTPIANIYLKNTSSKSDHRLDLYKKRDEVVDFVKKALPLFEQVSYSMDSIIFMHKTLYPGMRGATFIFELYYDWSCKISAPLGCTRLGQDDDFRFVYNQAGISDEILSEWRFIDGSALCNALFGGLTLFADIAKQYKLKEKDYAFCAEFENAAELVIGFYGAKYLDYIKTHGIPFALKENNRSQIIYLRNCSSIIFKTLSAYYVVDYFGPTFGFRADSIGDILRESNKIYTQ